MYNFNFAKRTDWSLSENKIVNCLNKLKQNNVFIYDLTISNPTKCQFHYSKKIVNYLDNIDNLKYNPESQGLKIARDAVVNYYKERGFDIKSDNIFLTASTSEAYSLLFRLLVDYDDSVLFPRPSYPLFEFLTDLNDIKIKYYDLFYDNNWQVDIGDLEETLENVSAKALVYVNPNNPTGSYLNKEEVKQLNAICLKNNLSIISDEVFWDYNLEENVDRSSFVENKEVLTFTLSGLSKALALPQMKLSWIVLTGPDSLVEQAKSRLEIINDTYLSVNTPVQNALSDWFEFAGEIQGEIKQRCLVNYQFLNEKLKLHDDMELFTTQGGWYAVIKVNRDISEEDVCLELLQKDQVYVHPGYFFDFDQEPIFVISLLSKDEIFKQAVDRMIARFLEQ